MAATRAIANRIQEAIRLYNGHKVMLDFDLAALYGSFGLRTADEWAKVGVEVINAYAT